MGEFKNVQFEMVGQVALVTLSRPKAANSLSLQMIDELFTTIEKIDKDSSIICTIFTAEGDRVFCAGADLKERKDMTDAQVKHTVKSISNLFTRISEMKMPTIAALNGVAYGGGLEFALSCDIRIASEAIRVGLTETSLAIIPGGGGTQRLARLIGIGAAKMMIFSSEPIDGNQAFSLGLIEHIVSRDDDVKQHAIRLANKISENGPIALSLAKKAIDEGYDSTLKDGLNLEYKYYKETIETKDRMEGLVAFSEKRPPVYRGE